MSRTLFTALAAVFLYAICLSMAAPVFPADAIPVLAVRAPIPPNHAVLTQRGLIKRSDVDVAKEMAKMIEAQRQYEAAQQAAKKAAEMAKKALNLNRSRKH